MRMSLIMVPGDNENFTGLCGLLREHCAPWQEWKHRDEGGDLRHGRKVLFLQFSGLFLRLGDVLHLKPLNKIQ